MAISKTTLVLFFVVIILIIWIACANSCNKGASYAKAKQSRDSALEIIQVVKENYNTMSHEDSLTISRITAERDSFKVGWETSKSQIISRDKRIVSLNTDYKAARENKDTITSLAKCDSLSNENDSLHNELWTVGRRLDSSFVINEQLKDAQDTALGHCRVALNATQTAASQLSKSYEAMLRIDEKQTRKEKNKGWLKGGIGTALGIIIKSIL